MYPKIVFSSPLEDRSYAKDEMDSLYIVLQGQHQIGTARGAEFR